MDEGKKFHFDNRYWDKPKQYALVSVYQIGDISCQKGFEVGEHQQPCFELSYIVSGKGDIFSDGQCFEVSQGDLHLSRPLELHNLIADRQDPFRYLYLAFWFVQGGINPFEHIERMFERIKTPLVHDRLNIDAPFKSLMKELYSPAEHSSLMVENYIQQIIVLAYRNHFSNWQQQYAELKRGEGGPGKDIVYAAISLIDNHLLELNNLAEVADGIGYSYSRLSHIFRDETGMTIQDYYNNKRMALAAKWIVEGQMSISEIAEKLNYQTLHSFSKAFKKKLGVSPAQYKVFSSKKP